MLTRKRFTPPHVTGDDQKDIESLGNALADYLRSLEQKNALTISQAQIYVDQGLQFPATQVASTDANNLDGYARGSWTPTVTAAAGAFTTVSATGKYTKIGNAYLIRVVITVTTNGTAATAIQFTLPVTTTEKTSLSGRENGNTGKGLAVDAQNGATTATVVNYDNTYPAANGSTLIISGLIV